MPSPHELMVLNESNRRLFQLLLKEGREVDLEAINDPVAQELQRLDSKIDVLIDMLGKLLFREFGMPGSHNIWLGKDGLQILLDTAADGDPSMTDFPTSTFSEAAAALSDCGCLLKASLFLDVHFPRPIELLAKAVKVETEDRNGLLVATFVELDKGVKELLEKFIFQQHRRVVALARAESKIP